MYIVVWHDITERKLRVMGDREAGCAVNTWTLTLSHYQVLMRWPILELESYCTVLALMSCWNTRTANRSSAGKPGSKYSETSHYFLHLPPLV